jgi:hypothetical protein
MFFSFFLFNKETRKICIFCSILITEVNKCLLVDYIDKLAVI